MQGFIYTRNVSDDLLTYSCMTQTAVARPASSVTKHIDRRTLLSQGGAACVFGGEGRGEGGKGREREEERRVR